MKKILCPVDFTSHSGTAAEWAAMIATKTNSNLVLLNKFLVSESDSAKKGKSEDLFSDAEMEAQEKLLSLKERLCQKFPAGPLKFDIHTAYGIDLDEIIIHSAKETQADMIVMATEGAERFTDIIFGSNATHVINRAKIPVLVIPAGVEVKLPDTIIYATDLKNEDCKLISFMLDFAHYLGSKVIFLHINNKSSEELAKLKAEISKCTDMEATRAKGMEISYDEIKSENLFAALQGYAEQKHAGLVVLGNHQKNFFQKLTDGDFTRLMTLYSFIPSLILQKSS